jgi:putative molybdenum carrier protein
MAGEKIARVVSGGQTGADRAGLDAAIAAGLPYGGWCPLGGWAEDLPEPPGLLAAYPQLRETPTDSLQQRTAWNVRDSDATLIVWPAGVSSPGSGLTLRLAGELERPVVVADPGDVGAAGAARAWLETLPDGITLNVAGPREGHAPGLYAAARRVLDELLTA